METPIVQALLICEQVIRDSKTGRYTLVNVMTTLFVERFPVIWNKCGVFVVLTNGNGEVKIDVKLSRVDTGEVIFGTSGPITFPSPNVAMEMAFDFKGIPFKEEGLYAFTLTCADEILGEARFGVQPRPHPPSQLPRQG